MPFLKFLRDKRGYEHFYVVEPVTGRRGRTRQRVLYWFRTPPNVKIGREPFDDQVMRALEAQYPGITFDWERLRNTPIPSVEPEHWRERRRAERAARRAQEEEEEDTGTTAGDPPTPEPPGVVGPAAAADIGEPSPGTSPDPVVSTVPAEPGPGRSAGQRRRRRGRRSQGDRGTAEEKTLPPDSSNEGPEDI